MGLTLIVTFVIKRAESSLAETRGDARAEVSGEFGKRQVSKKVRIQWPPHGLDGISVCDFYFLFFFTSVVSFRFTHMRQPGLWHKKKEGVRFSMSQVP